MTTCTLCIPVSSLRYLLQKNYKQMRVGLQFIFKEKQKHLLKTVKTKNI